MMVPSVIIWASWCRRPVQRNNPIKIVTLVLLDTFKRLLSLIKVRAMAVQLAVCDVTIFPSVHDYRCKCKLYATSLFSLEISEFI